MITWALVRRSGPWHHFHAGLHGNPESIPAINTDKISIFISTCTLIIEMRITFSGTASFTYQEHVLHSPKHISQQVKCICNSYNANTQTGVAWTNAETERLRYVFLRVSGLLSSANTKTLKSNYALEDETDEKWETPPPDFARQMCVSVCLCTLSFPTPTFAKLSKSVRLSPAYVVGFLTILTIMSTAVNQLHEKSLPS